jgi:hypothetical protein
LKQVEQLLFASSPFHRRSTEHQSKRRFVHEDSLWVTLDRWGMKFRVGNSDSPTRFLPTRRFLNSD